MRFLTIFFSAVLLAGSANAATVLTGSADWSSAEVACDDRVPLDDVFCVERDGYHISTSMAYPDGVTYLHDDSGASESFLGRVDRKGFSVRSATIIIQNLIWKASTKPMPPYDDDDTALRKWAFHNKPYDVVLNIIGVNDGEVVGQKQVKSRKSHLFDIKFGKTFGEVDMLFFQLSIPSFDHFFDFYEMLEPGQIWCGEFCGGAIVERISLDDPAPVPLPASLPLLGGALLFLGRRCIPAAGSAGVAALWRKAGSRAEFSSRA